LCMWSACKPWLVAGERLGTAAAARVGRAWAPPPLTSAAKRRPLPGARRRRRRPCWRRQWSRPAAAACPHPPERSAAWCRHLVKKAGAASRWKRCNRGICDTVRTMSAVRNIRAAASANPDSRFTFPRATSVRTSLGSSSKALSRSSFTVLKVLAYPEDASRHFPNWRIMDAAKGSAKNESESRCSIYPSFEELLHRPQPQLQPRFSKCDNLHILPLSAEICAFFGEQPSHPMNHDSRYCMQSEKLADLTFHRQMELTGT